MPSELLRAIRIPINQEADVVLARHTGRTLAIQLGFGESDPMFIATAISEIARNIVVHGVRGELTIAPVEESGRKGLVVTARDEGPGIADVEMAMRDGFSTVNSLGLGLPGARRLMDEFMIDTAPGKGTTIVMKKWIRGGQRARPRRLG